MQRSATVFWLFPKEFIIFKSEKNKIKVPQEAIEPMKNHREEEIVCFLSVLVFFKFLKNVFILRESARASGSRVGAERESPRQVPHCQLRV